MEENKNRHPEWLTNIQNNSWNPELIISGFSILLIFRLSSYVDQYVVSLVQETHIYPIIIFIGGLYVGVAFTALKIMFSIHLLLRGVWVGLVGITYVFPRGINFGNMPKTFDYEYIKSSYDDPIDAVLKLERICSSIFSITFALVGISVSIIIFLLFAALLLLAGLPLMYVLILTLGILLLASASSLINHISYKLTGRLLKPVTLIYKGYVKVISLFFFKETLVLFQTNLKKGVGMVGIAVLTMFVGIQTGKQISYTVFFFDELQLIGERELSFLSDSNRMVNLNYADESEEDVRVQKARLDRFITNQSMLELDIADYKWDQKSFEKVFGDTIDRHIDSLITIQVDQQTIEPYAIYQTNLNFMDQKAWKALIPIDNLTKGAHTLSVHKLDWDLSRNDTSTIKDWTVISFIKE